MHLPVHQLSLFRPVQQFGHFGLDTTVIGGSMQHDSWIRLSFHIQRAGVLSPRFSINLDSDLLFNDNFGFAALTHFLCRTQTDLDLAQMKAPRIKPLTPIPQLVLGYRKQ
jgi:hypothetical protein